MTIASPRPPDLDADIEDSEGRSRRALASRSLFELSPFELAAALERDAPRRVRRADQSVKKVYRHVLGGSGGHVEWDRPSLSALGLGGWTMEVLLARTVEPTLTLDESVATSDGSERLVLRARDGSLVEAVLIPGPARTTLCISSQVGCARACSFCETGKLGLLRQLSAAEIVDQVRVARALWAERRPTVTNIVFMGMGEPFDNLEEVARATQILSFDPGLKFAPSKITVSTVGVADKIEKFFQTCRAELAVSLNAATDTVRDAIMPINRRFPLATLVAEVERHLPKGHKVLFEYVLMRDRNDSRADAEALAELVRNVRCRVNVIPVNPGPDPSLRAPEEAALDAFVLALTDLGVVTLVRRPRGRAVGAACGQLAGLRRKSSSQAP